MKYYNLPKEIAILIFSISLLASCTKESVSTNNNNSNPGITGNATYVIGGSGSCPSVVVNGTYNVGTILDNTNTVVFNVNVTSVGAYSLNTVTQNGITFSKSDTFRTTGIQSVTLQGSGTPTTTNIDDYPIDTSSCNFSISPTLVIQPGVFCTINGVDKSFNYAAVADLSNPSDFTIEGTVSSSNVNEQVILEVAKTDGSSVTASLYYNSFDNTTLGHYTMSVYYSTPALAVWGPADVSSTYHDYFTITIYKLTSTQVEGTFSGTIRSNDGNGTSTMSITNGTFNLPL